MTPPAVPQAAIDKNRKALEWYDANYHYYDGLIEAEPPEKRAEALRQLAAHLPTNGVVLEIGSANGRDADFLESLGPSVRRTDITQGFIDLQAKRGKKVERLDLLTGDLGGPYEGIFALCVFLHVPPEATDAILTKIASALKPGGAFLVSVREIGDERATGWSRNEFAERLWRAGLHVVWEERDFDGDQWIEYVARRA